MNLEEIQNFFFQSRVKRLSIMYLQYNMDKLSLIMNIKLSHEKNRKNEEKKRLKKGIKSWKKEESIVLIYCISLLLLSV